MPSEADIVNDALSKIGNTAFIDSLNDATIEAQVAKLHYARRRDEVLESGEWPFATMRAPLAQLSENRDGWGITYAWPQGALKALAIPYPSGGAGSGPLAYPTSGTPYAALWTQYRALRPEQRIPFKIEQAADGTGRVILCDFSEASLVYVAQITAPNYFPALFQNALAWRLAIEFAGAIKKDANLMQFAMNAYVRALGDARTEALREGQEDQPSENAIVASRR